MNYFVDEEKAKRKSKRKTGGSWQRMSVIFVWYVWCRNSLQIYRTMQRSYVINLGADFQLKERSWEKIEIIRMNHFLIRIRYIIQDIIKKDHDIFIEQCGAQNSHKCVHLLGFYIQIQYVNTIINYLTLFQSFQRIIALCLRYKQRQARYGWVNLYCQSR